MFHSKAQKFEPSARVVDGKLILSFPNAISPIVWQMDLNDVKASALEVTTAKDGETYALTLKTPKGENVQVAPFANKNEAVEGLMAASSALENAHGAIAPGSAAAGSYGGPHGKKSRWGKWGGIALGVLLIFVLLNILAAIANQNPQNMTQTSGVSTTAANPTEPGVPVSADDFLNAQ